MDANEYRHHQWIGMAQPEGLVVTTATLKAAEANITWPVTELQATLPELAGEGKAVRDLRAFLREVLEWSDEFIVASDALPASLRVQLDGHETLAPALALQSADEPGSFVLLVGEASRIGIDLDAATDDKRWTATAHQRFEWLLRETGIPIGLLTNGKAFRLVYAPKGESAGWITFRLNEMLSVDGRPLLGALHMLLNERRLLSLEDTKRLPALLKASREYQNTVSNALREQVLSALRELLIGFQDADRGGWSHSARLQPRVPTGNLHLARDGPHEDGIRAVRRGARPAPDGVRPVRQLVFAFAALRPASNGSESARRYHRRSLRRLGPGDQPVPHAARRRPRGRAH